MPNQGGAKRPRISNTKKRKGNDNKERIIARVRLIE